MKGLARRPAWLGSVSCFLKSGTGSPTCSARLAKLGDVQYMLKFFVNVITGQVLA
jgi:hypothetical protein